MCTAPLTQLFGASFNTRDLNRFNHNLTREWPNTNVINKHFIKVLKIVQYLNDFFAIQVLNFLNVPDHLEKAP